MAIYRSKKERDFFVLDNAVLRDPNLSLKAKGLLAFCLSRPNDWCFSVKGLSRFSADGPDAVRSAVQELEKTGYIVRRRKREKGKYREMEYDIFEKPVLFLPIQEEPKKDNPPQKNGPLPNIEIPNTELLNTAYINNPSTNLKEIEQSIRNQIEYGIMCQRYDQRQLDDLVSVMTEVMLYTGDTITISRDKAYPTRYMQETLHRIGPLHIEQIMEYLIANRPEIRNIRGYLLTALINAANTLDMGCEYGEGYAL